MSHTATIAADYAERGALARAVEALGGTIIGEGEHRLYDRSVIGYGIKLAGWRYPIVAAADGTLAYDDYRGKWGDVADLDALHAQYSWAIAELAAQRIGWQSERCEEGVRIYLPSGGLITVTADTVDASGFVGNACEDAMAQLRLPVKDVIAKPARAAVAAQAYQAE